MLNPFAYRGYCYDADMGLYYLQSRYYDPNTGRFINADDTNYLGATSTVLSYNLFAYCENDPVNLTDPAGTAPGDKFATMDQAARDFARKYNKISIKNNCEYATIIVRIKNKRPPYKNYFYSYKYITPWTNGKKTEVDTKRNIWGKYDTVAFIHTHGRYHKGTNYSNKYFSDTDINISNNTGMPMYVVLPSGICCYHNPNNQNENRSFKWSGVYHDKKALSKHRRCKLCVNY